MQQVNLGKDARVNAAIRKRIAKYGLRVICQYCLTETRHYPQLGRLRKKRCPQCGLCELRPKWWVRKFKTKAIAERKELREAYPDL